MDPVNNRIANQEIKKLQVANIHRNESFEILSISLEQGNVFPEHTSSKDAVLLVLEGAIAFHMEGKTYPLKKRQLFSFQKDTAHWVEAIKDARFLIIR